MKFSGKMWLMIILKVKKPRAIHPLGRIYIFRKTTTGCQIDHPKRQRVNSLLSNHFWFLTLYINITHHKWKHATKELIDFCFKNKQTKYIAITKYFATRVNDTNKHSILFDKISLSWQLLHYLVIVSSMLAI